MGVSKFDIHSLRIPLLVEERSGLERTSEPVTVGIPLPRGVVFELSQLVLLKDKNQPAPLQVEALSRWFDGSAKWVLLDFQADVEGGGTSKYLVECRDRPEAIEDQKGIAITESPEFVAIDTGCASFSLGTTTHRPFNRVLVDGRDFVDSAQSEICLVDNESREYWPQIRDISVETRGRLRVTLCARGEFQSPDERTFADFISRLSFYANSGLVEMKFTLRNSSSAHHPGGLWDLGDEGSVYFKDLSMRLALSEAAAQKILWTAGPGQPPVEENAPRFEIYQDSSGGHNWKSTNHVNRFGKLGSTFRGYRVKAGGVTIQEGKRSNPVVSIRTEDKVISAAIQQFWQNFPKSIDVEDNRLSLRFFPKQFQDIYELQGGEQKTHTAYLLFEGSDADSGSLEWIHDRLAPRTTPSWYSDSKAISYLAPPELSDKGSKSLKSLESLVDSAVTGENTFFHRREIIDEYGWRNFGDLYADHEAIGHTGDRPLVAHYNNQYDVIQGAVIQYFRSGNMHWFELASDLAKHVIDIDIYHTREDRKEFNGGLFWHTQHYTDAATATHRAYSKMGRGDKSRYQAGGGPSSEHNYTTGLLHYYFLSGDLAAKETVKGLADWVINMDRRSEGFLGFFDRRPRGLSSMTVSADYHGPGRGCGNSINALLDAFVVTRYKNYWDKAEELIRRSIHPNDDIGGRDLDDVEHRWSYTVFLQVLGKYLDLKADMGELDYMYVYAKESLLHYARWMLNHELPYASVLDKVEIPTETWPAQDIRKCNVLKFAAKYSDEPLRSKCLEKADFFFDRCMNDLLEFKTCTLTRPIVLLMTNGHMQPYFLAQQIEPAPTCTENYDFGEPKAFKPQFSEIVKARERIINIISMITDVRSHIRDLFQRKERKMVDERA
jgi:YetA-like protein